MNSKNAIKKSKESVDDIIARANSNGNQILFDAERLAIFIYQLYKQMKADKIENWTNHR